MTNSCITLARPHHRPMIKSFPAVYRKATERGTDSALGVRWRNLESFYFFFVIFVPCDSLFPKPRFSFSSLGQFTYSVKRKVKNGRRKTVIHQLHHTYIRKGSIGRQNFYVCVWVWVCHHKPGNSNLFLMNKVGHKQQD